MQPAQSPKVLDSKIKQELESFLYKNNYYVDMRDMSGTWIVGKIIEVNLEEMILKIRMEGTRQETVIQTNNYLYTYKTLFYYYKEI